MGNCMDRQRAVSWADDGEGEGWEEEEMASPHHYHHGREEDQEVDGDRDLLLGGAGRVVPSLEVKIKISKKQLEELLRQGNVMGLSIQEALAGLVMRVGEKGVCDHCRQWRPELQSIPEAAGDDA